MRTALMTLVFALVLLGATGKKQENSYLACGCGCCPETIQKPMNKCVDKKSGETLESIEKADRAKKAEGDCNLAGCSQAILYKVCN